MGARSLSSGPRERGVGAALPAWLALCTIGCVPELEPELGVLVARGEHVEVWASEGVEVCGGNVELMDRFVERFRAVVGPRAEAEAMHRYHVLDEDGWQEWADAGGCPEAAGGCTVQRRTIYTRVGLPSLHELVHAELYGEHDSYLEEGIAELYGCPRLGGSPGERSVEEGIDVRGAYIPQGDYARAAHFARFLVDRHGVDGFLRVRDATTTESDYDAVERAFASALGVTLGEELERYAGYSDRCVDAGYRVALLECELPAIAWQDGGRALALSLDLACDSPTALGPFHGEIFGLGAMEIAEHGVYELRFDAPGAADAVAWVTACDAKCAEDPPVAQVHAYEPALAPAFMATAVRVGHPVAQRLHPGKYWLRLARPSHAPGLATLRVTRRSDGGAEPASGG